MLSPNPLSLLCALLLCLPLAIVFTNTTTPAADISHISAGNPNENNLRTLLLTSRKQKILRSDSKSDRSTANSKSPSPPPSIPLTEPLDDDSLFRLAARVKSKPTFPKKLAFMFLTNTPLPLSPLWELYFNDSPTATTNKNLYNIYVHADPFYPYDPPFIGVFQNRVIHSQPVARNTPTLISAARRLLARALLDDTSNSMFALLSPSCVPLHSFNFTYKTLVRSRKSFIEILKNEVGAYDRWAARGAEAMLPEITLEDFRIGSQFWVLTRRHARLVVSDRRLWSKFDQPCVVADTCYPEENYFPTLLSMWDPRGCVPATLTHVDWAGRGDGHPRTYEGPEVGLDLIQSLRKARPRYGESGVNVSGSDCSVNKRHDPFLFARKFGPDALEPLTSIANDVLFRD